MNLNHSRAQKSRYATSPRNVARALGEKRYSTGKPCKNGHMAQRMTVSGVCCVCVVEYLAKYQDDNVDVLAEKRRKYRAANIDEIRKRKHRAYHADPAKCIARTKAWTEANSDWVRERKKLHLKEHREEHRARTKACRQKPEIKLYRRNFDKARNARKKGLQIGDRKAYTAFMRWAETAPTVPCHWCKKKTRPKGRHMDHIIPLAKGGADAVGNLCISCPACNISKGAKLPEHFAPSGQSELRLT